jgi:hypothetical protein
VQRAAGLTTLCHMPACPTTSCVLLGAVKHLLADPVATSRAHPTPTSASRLLHTRLHSTTVPAALPSILHTPALLLPRPQASSSGTSHWVTPVTAL